jgi:anti-anti-sigma regulatory factor
MAPVPAPTAVLTEVVDTRAGVVRATGVLTASGADLLCGAVETLQRLGHRRVTLDLTGVHDADDEGIALLEELCGAGAGGAPVGLVVRRPVRGAS